MENKTVAWSTMLQDAVTQPGIISSAYSAFHNYSMGNQILAWSQLTARDMGLSPLATYKRWSELGRQVKKGEIAIVPEMDGIFPDWRRVARYDDAPYPNQVFFNPHYLVRVADAADLISERKFAVQVRPGGTGVGFATLDHEGKTVAYIMPIRGTIDDLPSKPTMTY